MEENTHSEEHASDLKGRLKHLYGELTTSDFPQAEIEKQKILLILQQKLGKSKEELQTIIDSL